MPDVRFRDIKVGQMATRHGGDWVITGEIERDEYRTDRTVIARCDREDVAMALAEAININNALTPRA